MLAYRVREHMPKKKVRTTKKCVKKTKKDKKLLHEAEYNDTRTRACWRRKNEVVHTIARVGNTSMFVRISKLTPQNVWAPLIRCSFLFLESTRDVSPGFEEEEDSWGDVVTERNVYGGLINGFGRGVMYSGVMGGIEPQPLNKPCPAIFLEGSPGHTVHCNNSSSSLFTSCSHGSRQLRIKQSLICSWYVTMIHLYLVRCRTAINNTRKNNIHRMFYML